MRPNLADKIQVLDVLPAADVTSSGNGTAIDLLDYEGEVAFVLSSSAGSGTSPTLDIKLQDSADNSSFADISGAAFAQVTDAAASVEKIGLNSNEIRRYVRAVKTAGGTSPSFACAVIAVGMKKYG